MRLADYFLQHRWLLFILLAVTAYIYYPGLDGRFILDDYYNLGELDQIDTYGYSYYVFSGISGPSGRPISLLSFALQYQHWPDNPFAFKLINLVIHLLNGILVFFVCRLLSHHLKLNNRETNTLSLLTTTLWLLHPMQVSTVLYTVQRMTELAAFFIFFGIYGYLQARILYEKENKPVYLIVMTAIVGACTLLSILSKENGILLPLFIIVIEASLFSGASKTKLWRIWAWICLGLPLILVSLYLAANFGDVLLNYQSRQFTMSQRLLTEPLILMDSIGDLIIPHPSAFSLFHDDYPISTGIFTPPITFFAIISLIVLIIFSLLIRKKFKVISFAILWFFSGHVLESSYLNLELYFEHRNYIPSLGMFFLIGWLIVLSWKELKNKILAVVLISTFYGMVITITMEQVIIWSNPARQAVEWLRIHPKSLRAIENLGGVYIKLGEYNHALETYHQINEIYPLEIYPYIKDVSVKYCLQNKIIDDEEWNKIFARAVMAKWYGFAPLAELDTLAREIQKDKCQMGDIINLMRLILVLAQNPGYEPYRGALHEIATTLAIQLKDGASALANIMTSLDAEPTPSRHVLKIRILLELGFLSEAEEAMIDFDQYIRKNVRYKIVYKDILKSLKDELHRLKT